MRDVLGKEIKVGDTVACGMRRGNSGAISVGEVLAIETAEGWNGGKYEMLKVRHVDGNKRTTTWTCPDRMVVVQG